MIKTVFGITSAVHPSLPSPSPDLSRCRVHTHHPMSHTTPFTCLFFLPCPTSLAIVPALPAQLHFLLFLLLRRTFLAISLSFSLPLLQLWPSFLLSSQSPYNYAMSLKRQHTQVLRCSRFVQSDWQPQRSPWVEFMVEVWTTSRGFESK